MSEETTTTRGKTHSFTFVLKCDTTGCERRAAYITKLDEQSVKYCLKCSGYIEIPVKPNVTALSDYDESVEPIWCDDCGTEMPLSSWLTHKC